MSSENAGLSGSDDGVVVMVFVPELFLDTKDRKKYGSAMSANRSSFLKLA